MPSWGAWVKVLATLLLIQVPDDVSADKLPVAPALATPSPLWETTLSSRLLAPVLAVVAI